MLNVRYAHMPTLTVYETKKCLSANRKIPRVMTYERIQMHPSEMFSVPKEGLSKFCGKKPKPRDSDMFGIPYVSIKIKNKDPIP